MLFSYGYFLSVTMLHAVESRELEFQTTRVNTSIATLEFEYLKMQSDITLENAKHIGLMPITAKRYITRSSYVASAVR